MGGNGVKRMLFSENALRRILKIYLAVHYANQGLSSDECYQVTLPQFEKCSKGQHTNCIVAGVESKYCGFCGEEIPEPITNFIEIEYKP